MLFLLPHFLSCLMLFICVSCQLLYENPDLNSIITCGFMDSCSIICNEANSCESSEFYLYSDDAYIECSGQSSCQSLKIFSINTTQLTLHFNGINAFINGIAYIQQSNSNITTQCLNEQSCSESSFYYNGIGQTVKHYCNDIGSCNDALISALPINVIYIECYDCNNMDIYIPINILHTSIININGSIFSSHIYSINGLTNLNIICNGDCNRGIINDMYIIYGIEYQSYCAIYDTLCMESNDINDISYSQIDENIIIKYVFDDDYNGLILNNAKILLFILPSLSKTSQTSNMIQTSQSSEFIHVICVDHIHYPSCNNIHFDFSFTNYAILTANNAQSIIITGPINHYKRIAYRNNNNNNIYHLQATSNILLQCNQLKGGQCLNNSMLYTGSTTNVTVLCGSDDCHYSTIYSNINPLQTTQSLSTSGFNIICYPSSTSCNPQFKLNFSNTIICDSPYDPNCINFLSTSPTLNPTISPITSSPSISPSYNPSIPPTISPSFDPTYAPTFTPTNYPSKNPTNIPTYSPSITPTYTPTPNPTLSPTPTPSIAPTFSPTKYPSFSPTQPPTNAPTFSPTISPTFSPVQPPTHAPTFTPTQSPTKAPTRPPTKAPTDSPTITPTDSPTNYPTKNIHKHVSKVDYILTNITRKIFLQLHETETQQELEQLFEYCYLLYSYGIIDDPDQYLNYYDFDLQIIDVSPSLVTVVTPSTADTNMQWFNESATLKSDIKYAEDSVGTNIRFITKQLKFKNVTQYKLREYFNDHALLLEISKPEQLKDPVRKISDEMTGFLILIMSIGSICILVAIASFIYNNWVPNSVTDNGNSFAVPLFGLQLVDFFSDINLCVEMFTKFKGSRFIDGNESLYIAAWGTLTFSVLPYTTNLIMATNIKNIKEIKDNPFARSYFQTTSWFFIVLTVFCGGVYPSLSIVSSRLFGFEFLNSGLTMMEMTKLTKIRFFTTILMENIPQLCCSLLYINYLGTVSPNAVLSMVMSVLQITSAILNYIIVRKPSDCRAIQYDLEMKVGVEFLKPVIKSGKEGIKSASIISSTMDLDDLDTDLSDDDNDDTINSSELPVLEVAPGTYRSTLNKQQKQLIRNKKERKHSLRQWLCTEMSLKFNAIEIGYVTLTPHGCIIHIIHYTFESEAKAFRDLRLKRKNSRISPRSPHIKIPPISTQIANNNTTEIELETIKDTEVTGTSCEQIALKSYKSLSYDNLVFARSRSYERWDGDEKSFEKTAKSLFKSLYKENAKSVNCAFASHFGFNPKTVCVTYHKNYTYSDWEVINKRNFSYHHLENINESDIDIGKFSIQDIGTARRSTVELPKAALMVDTGKVKLSGDRSNRSTHEESKSCASQTPTEEMKVGLGKMEELSKIIIDKLEEKDEEQCKEELLEEGYDANLIDRIMMIGKYMSSLRITTSKADLEITDVSVSDDKFDDENENEDENENTSDKSDQCDENNNDDANVNVNSDTSENSNDLEEIIINKCDKSDESVNNGIMDTKVDAVKQDDNMEEVEEVHEMEDIDDDNISTVSDQSDMVENVMLQISDGDNESEDKIGGNKNFDVVKDNSDSDQEKDMENVERNIVNEDSVSDNYNNEEIDKHVDENVSDEENINDSNTDMNKQHPS